MTTNVYNSPANAMPSAPSATGTAVATAMADEDADREAVPEALPAEADLNAELYEAATELCCAAREVASMEREALAEPVAVATWDEREARAELAAPLAEEKAVPLSMVLLPEAMGIRPEEAAVPTIMPPVPARVAAEEMAAEAEPAALVARAVAEETAAEAEPATLVAEAMGLAGVVDWAEARAARAVTKRVVACMVVVVECSVLVS